MSGEEKSKRVFSIRGLDPEIYDRFAKVARELGVSVGELMNEAMRFMLSLVSVGTVAGVEGIKLLMKSLRGVKGIHESLGNVEVISGLDELEVSREDLESIDKPVIFMNIKKLVFKEGIDRGLIESKVRGIKLIDEVVVPKSIPKLIVARKCSMVRKLVSSE